MLFEASNRKLGFSGLLALAFGLAFNEGGESNTRVTTEQGEPGSGVKSVTRYHSPVGFGPALRYVETARHTLYEDGRDEWRYFSEDGRLVRQEVRFADGHNELILNVEGGLKSRLALGVGDEVYLVSDSSEAGRRVQVSLSKTGTLAASQTKLDNLPKGYKLLAGYRAEKSGAVKALIATTVRNERTGLLDFTPPSTTTVEELKVKVR